MTRLTRYVLAAYLSPLFAGTGALVLLVMMADLMERLGKFIAMKSGAASAIQYIFALIPLRLVEILPVAALLASILSVGSLSHRKELVAAMSGGVHPWRCVRPILWSGVVLSLLCFGLGEFVNPSAHRKARKIWDGDIRRLAVQRRTRYDRVTAAGERGVFYAIGSLDTAEGRMRDVIVDRTEGGLPRSQIQAREALWRDGTWVFTDGVERFFSADGLSLAGLEPFASRAVEMKDSPRDLAPADEDTASLGVKALGRHIRRLKRLGVPTRALEVDLQMKLALPWANFVVLLLGIPFAFRKTDGKMKAVAFALGAAFLYFGLMQVGRALGQKTWCPPWAGAWMANIFFLAAGGVMFNKMRRLGR